MKPINVFGILLVFTIQSVSGAVIYTADFSVAGQGSTHDTSGSDPV